MRSKRPKRREIDRLSVKTLDDQFLTEIQKGLNCSPFEGEAVLSVVREIFAPLMGGESTSGRPGTMTVIALDADEPAGKPLAKCRKRTVSLLVHRGAEDDRLMYESGAEAFRRARIPDLCQQAFSKGALLTREDLAYRILFVSPRTISRDLQALRRADPDAPIPLRGTVQDIGPVLTHRVQIVRLALQGKTMTQICQRMHHSPSAVANYLSSFTRCAQLYEKGMLASKIAFLLDRSRGLIDSYLELLADCRKDKTLAYHLAELLALGTPKKTAPRPREVLP
jgi:DNA-binding CsgD family transcriptional regulator/DNA-binding transcriptional ArsR family regulator